MGSGTSIFRLLSALNGWSLVCLGGISLIVSSIAMAWAGILVSVAATLHGIFELVLRKKMQGENSGSVSRRMALNQLGLAASLSLYFAYQVSSLDEDALMTLLLKSPLYDALLMYPDEIRIQFMETLPRMVGLFYVAVAGITWLVCGATAIYYWRQGKNS